MGRIPTDGHWEQIKQDHTEDLYTQLARSRIPAIKIKTPKEIVAELDKTVIGQDIPKQLIAVAAFNRLLSLSNRMTGRDTEEFYFEKNNVLMLGGTGCGKTHIMRAVSRAVGLPVTIQDATSFSSTGYVGRDIEECVDGLFDAARILVDEQYNGDQLTRQDKGDLIATLVSHGIVYMDEADKIRTSTASGKDVNGRAVQESCLKLVEGTVIPEQTGGMGGKGTVRAAVDTHDILFVFGGAFTGIEEIIKTRTHKKTIGFTQDEPTIDVKDMNNIRKQSTIGDFVQFGMIPELMGRLSTIAVLDDLDKDTIYRIFSEPERSILSQVTNEFKSYGCDVRFTEDAIGFIVDKAIELKLGARGLKSVCQSILRPLYYTLPSSMPDKTVIISKKLLVEMEDW